MLTELGEVLDGSAGPYVLSDLRWRNGPLYVRYGGFVERYCLSETGSVERAMMDPQGRWVPDRRSPTFRYPDWVLLPAFLEPHLAARNSVKVDGLPYRIERALHFSNGVPAAFLDEAVQVIGEQSSVVSQQPFSSHRLDPEYQGWERIRTSLAGAILASATPTVTTGCFPAISSSSKPAA